MEEKLQADIKRTKWRTRVFGFIGMGIGALNFYINPTYFNELVTVTCSYWFFWFIASGVIFMIYIIFVKILVDSIYMATHNTFYMMQSTVSRVEVITTYFEAFLIGLILFAISGGFAVFAARCALATYSS